MIKDKCSTPCKSADTCYRHTAIDDEAQNYMGFNKLDNEICKSYYPNLLSGITTFCHEVKRKKPRCPNCQSTNMLDETESHHVRMCLNCNHKW